MKNKFIEEKLNSYVEAVKPDCGLIEPARSELRKKRGSVPYTPQKPRGLVWQITAVAAILIFLVSMPVYYFMSTKNPSTDPAVTAPPAQYSISKLTYAVVPPDEIGHPVMLIDIKDGYINARVYSDKNKPVTVSVYYKTVGEGGLDEIVVVADIGGGLTDYKGFKDGNKTTINGVNVYTYQTLKNGEYYTEAYFEYADIDYYVMVMSPLSQNAHGYLELLLAV